MKKGTIKGLALIAAVLMVASILPITALADSGNSPETAPGPLEKNNPSDTFDPVLDRDRDSGVDMDMERERDRDSLNTQKRTNIQDAKNDYNKMTSEFQMIKDKQARGQLTSEEMFDESKDYLNGTIDYMIIRLDDLKESGDYSQEVNDTIDDHIAELEEIRVDVKDAETRNDLSDASKDIRNVWKDAIKDIKNSSAINVNNGLQNYLAKTNRVSERLQNEINRMEQNGQDTDELQKMLDDYNALIQQANEEQERARIAYQNGDPEAREYLGECVQTTNEANNVLRELLQEMKQSRRGFVNMEGEGPLNAEGDGTIVLSGQLNVTINATEARLVIKDLAGDAEINITGEYELVNEDRKTDECCSFVYDDFTGDAFINGTRLTIMVRGEDIKIFAEGTGSASLSGEGSYLIGEGDDALEMEFADDDSSDDDSSDDDSSEDDSSEDDSSEDDSSDDDSSDDDSSDDDSKGV
ncbi:hypothetical protein [Methanococcoides methylutens]|uniref:hypothetical protein n=1 Tax=Methanococcoides methylutens TaxID=2226 RepID=UPI0010828795|nr:hypothetical protein [Methanococcoides methylutens]